MTLSEALLIDAIWWFDHMAEFNYTATQMVTNVRTAYGWKYSSDDEVEIYFNLLIREAIKDDIP